MNPEPFKNKPLEREQEEFQNSIHLGYRKMDRALRDLGVGVPKDAFIILSTARSRQPSLIYKETGGKTLYRPRTLGSLLRFAGNPNWTSVEPIMSEQFHVRFASEDEASDAAHRLVALQVDGRSALTVPTEGNSVTTGCRIFEPFALQEVMLQGNRGEASVFYHEEGTRSGMHHPDRIPLIRAPEGYERRGVRCVSLLGVALTMLDSLDIKPPSYIIGVIVVRSRRRTVAPRPKSQWWKHSCLLNTTHRRAEAQWQSGLNEQNSFALHAHAMIFRPFHLEAVA